MNIRYRLSHALIVVLALSLTACTFDWRRSKDPDTKLRESLEVPPDLARPGGAETAPPPAPVRAPAPQPATSAAPATPTAPSADAALPRVRLERDGGLRWLTVQGDPQGVWKQVREYFVRNETKLVVDDPAGRALETDWIDRPVNLGTGYLAGLVSKLHSSGLRDKYRVRIEPGRVPQTAEVYVAHRLLEEIVTEGGGVDITQTKWLPRSGNPQMEADMLNKLLAYLGTGSSGPLTASTGVDGASSTQVQRTKAGLLLVSEEMDTAWRRVGQVLDRSGVRIEDRDRSTGVYYVQFISSGSKEKSGGVFSWLIGDSSESDKEATNTDRFQVALKSVDGGVQIVVNNVAGEPATSKAGQELLGLLQRQLH